MKAHVAAGIASAAILLLPQHAEAQCMKWYAFLSACQVYPNLRECQYPEQLSWPQRRFYYSKWLTDDPQKACQNSYYNFPFYTGPVKARIDPAFPDSVECWIDYNSDNIVELPENNPNTPDGYQLIVHYDEVAREPECDLIPNGRYGDDVTGPATPVAGGSFSESVRNQIRFINESESRVVGRNSSDAPADPIQFPVGTRETLPPYEDDPDDDWPYKGTWESATQIDHIIPRKDIHGCACGTNSPANAAVVSAKHNNAMSNRMDDPGRIELLTMFTNYVAPLEASEDEGPHSISSLEDEDEDLQGDPLQAGCSVGRSGAQAWLGLLVLGLLRLRRRWGTR